MPTPPTPITLQDRQSVYEQVRRFDDMNKRNPMFSELVKGSQYTKTFLNRIVRAMLRSGELYTDGYDELSKPLVTGNYPK